MSEKTTKKTKKEKKTEEKPQSIDLTAFLTGPSPETKEKSPEEKAYFTDEVEKIVLSELAQAGNKLPKSKLYEKVIRRGVKPVIFYQALTRLMEKGKVKRIFDPEIEEYVYVAG
jgi:hypothetical protein